MVSTLDEKLANFSKKFISESWRKKMQGKRVIVGMSGGVDSAVAAALLKGAGAEVIALFMKNWDEGDAGNPDSKCSSAEDFKAVVSVCDQLEIPYYSVNFVKEYNQLVFQSFLQDYRAGLTPNPDILCNKEIKFHTFFEHAAKLKADFLATGHYAGLSDLGTLGFQLTQAKDKNKDQSYFLYQVDSQCWPKVVFPLQDITKPEVRDIATNLGLSNQDKKDSTGICFIGERNFQKFLPNYIDLKEGEFRNLSENRVGIHQGQALYTLGQRKGLKLGGAGEPWFVVGKNRETNVVYVERGDKHPALFSDWIVCEKIFWQARGQFEGNCFAKSRYRQKSWPCQVQVDENGMRVHFTTAHRALTPGQSIVLYNEDEESIRGRGYFQSGPQLLAARQITS